MGIVDAQIRARWGGPAPARPTDSRARRLRPRPDVQEYRSIAGACGIRSRPPGPRSREGRPAWRGVSAGGLKTAVALFSTRQVRGNLEDAPIGVLPIWGSRRCLPVSRLRASEHIAFTRAGDDPIGNVSCRRNRRVHRCREPAEQSKAPCNPLKMHPSWSGGFSSHFVGRTGPRGHPG